MTVALPRRIPEMEVTMMAEVLMGNDSGATGRLPVLEGTSAFLSNPRAVILGVRLLHRALNHRQNLLVGVPILGTGGQYLLVIPASHPTLRCYVPGART